MSKLTVVLISIGIVAGGHVGTAFIHEDFQWYFCGAIFVTWIGAYIFMRQANLKLACALADLPEEQRIEFLNEMDGDQRNSIETLIEKKLQNKSVQTTAASRRV